MSGLHTPGPWAVSGCRYRMNGGEWQNISSYDAANKRDINVAVVSIDPQTLEGIADARLIAAAPDLLNTLQALDEYLVGFGDPLATTIKGIVSHAIAKAVQS